MKDVEREIAQRVDEFVKDLTVLVRRAALAAVSQALGGQPSPGASPRRAGARASGGKRSLSELEALSNRLLQHVATNPGQRTEQIAKALRMTTKDLALPMRKLVQGGALTTKGQKRATAYFPGSGAVKKRSASK